MLPDSDHWLIEFCIFIIYIGIRVIYFYSFNIEEIELSKNVTRTLIVVDFKGCRGAFSFSLHCLCGLQILRMLRKRDFCKVNISTEAAGHPYIDSISPAPACTINRI